MKYCIAILMLITTACAFVGCQRTPTVDAVYTIAYAGGTGTALVMNETKLDTEKRTVLRDIVVEIQACTPEVGQPLEAAWTPIAQQHVDLLVQEGKIDSASAVLIMAGFRTAMVGVNLLEQRYPVIRSGRDYTNAAISGFTVGFLERFKVECDDCRDCTVQAIRLGIDRSVVQEVRRAAIRNKLK